MSSLSNQVSKETLARELNQTVPALTKRLKDLGLPYQNQLVEAQHANILRREFGAGGGSKQSPSPTLDTDISIPAITGTNGPSKSADELAAMWGCTKKTVLGYAASADLAWRPAARIVPGADGKFSSEQVAMIADCRQCVTGGMTHGRYITMRAASLYQAAQDCPTSMTATHTASEDELGFAELVGEATRSLEEEFNQALDVAMGPVVADALDQLQPQQIRNRFLRLATAAIAERELPPSTMSLKELMSAAGRSTRHFVPSAIAGLLGGGNHENS